jgi:hypothetical protein
MVMVEIKDTRMVSLSSVTRQYNFSLTIGFPVGICSYAQMNALFELGINLEWTKLESQEEKKIFFLLLHN